MVLNYVLVGCPCYLHSLGWPQTTVQNYIFQNGTLLNVTESRTLFIRIIYSYILVFHAPTISVRECGFRNKANVCFWNLESLALESEIQLKESRIQVPLTKTGRIQSLQSEIKSLVSRTQVYLEFSYKERPSRSTDARRNTSLNIYYLLII